MSRVFISHAVADRELALLLAEALKAGSPPRDTFLSSRAGDIRADAEWLPAIQAAILQAADFLILLTPNSASRPWISFETGAAWFAHRPLVLARTSDLALEEVAWPVGSRQIYRLDQPDELSVVFHALQCGLPDPHALAARIGALPSRSAGTEEHAWEGILFNGEYFAWAGPLSGLEDRWEIEAPAGLVEELRSRGITARLGRQDKLTHHFGRGRAQVFATDRKSWRRPVVQGDQLLLVAPHGIAADGDATA